MTNVLAQGVVVLNAVANALGRILLVPVGVLPGWLSATLVASITGVLLLVVFKYTSNQGAIKRVRNSIDANMLTLRLFKDSTLVTLRAQAGMIAGACRLMMRTLVPMAVMAVPVMLVLGQLSLWYQSRPLRVGEEAVITLALNGDAGSPLTDVGLQPTPAAEVEVGPVRVLGKREICWRVTARQNGLHHLTFDVGGQSIDKEFAVGDGFMRVSPLRPAWDWESILLNPEEPPFRPVSPVRSIEITYPGRTSWIYGTNYWVIYWFIVSMVAALCFRRAIGVSM